MTDETITIKASTGEDLDTESSPKVCGVCLKTVSKYTCPRCNVPYCSVDCYKSDKHRDCSEMFYKDCFLEGLKDSQVDPDEKRKVMEILSRAETDPDLDVLDGSDDLDLEERLENLDLEKDADKVWERLTDQEKKEFEHMISDGRLGNILEAWTPWWKQDVPVVTEMDETEKETDVPKIKSNIQKLSDLAKTKPSADVKYNLLNILYAYIYICRLHNGDHVSMATESASDLINLSDVLGQGQSFGSVHDAVQPCFSKLQSKQSGFDSSLDHNVSVLIDIQDIILCPIKDNPLQYILIALSDVYEIFRLAHKATLKQKKTSDIDRKDGLTFSSKTKLFQCKKKCEFMLSWTQSYGMCMQNLIPDLNVEYSLMKSDLDLFNQTKRELELKWGGNVKPKKNILVEEL